MAVRNYTTLYRIKDFLLNNTAPKYLSNDEINISQVGLFGYITETLANQGEDGMNSTSIVFKECFANAAENIESLYLMAAIYQLENFFATPATMQFALIINEAEMIMGGKVSNGSSIFRIDGDTLIRVDDIPFMMEYDVQVTSRKTSKGYAHNVQYIMDKKVSMSSITNQYIRSKVIHYMGENYLAMLVRLRQMRYRDYEETIMANDTLSACEYTYNVGKDDQGVPLQIAGFEAWYTGPGSKDKRIQLVKKLENTTKESVPFCFYTMPDEGALKISFTNDDRYFVPEFNGKLEVRIYITDGETGNFDKYMGTNINIIANNSKFEENNGLILFGQACGDSRGGHNSPTKEEFRQQVIAAQSTVQSYTTNNDLDIFFKKMVNSGNTKIMFMKRRDDSLIRLFNAFTLLRDPNNVVIPTNTCDVYIEEEDIDAQHPESYRSIMKAGGIYRYSDIFEGALQVDHSLSLKDDDLDQYESDFIYTLPFLVIMSSRPVNVGLYMNSIDDNVYLDSDNVNVNSFVQFMISGLQIHRNALLDENDYFFSLNIIPTAEELAECITKVEEDTEVLPTDRTFEKDGDLYIDRRRIRVLLVFTDSGAETCYIELEVSSFSTSDQYYTFTGKVTTDDFVTANNKMRLVDSVKSINNGQVYSEKFIPCSGIKANVYIFYKYDEDDTIEQLPNRLSGVVIDNSYTLTNRYKSESTPIDLIKPLDMIRSFLSYNPYLDLDGKQTYNFRIGSVPMVKANYVKDPDRFHNFVNNFTDIYNYLESEKEKVTNNFSIDIKFYNTFGHSKHYNILKENETFLLDRLNIRFGIGIKPYYTTDIENLVRDLQDYIIKYMDSSFDSHGNNSFHNSNLVKAIETDFADKIEFLTFRGINDYPLTVQNLEPFITDENIQEYYDSMLDYVPEYINPYYVYDGTKWTPQIDISILN